MLKFVVFAFLVTCALCTLNCENGISYPDRWPPICECFECYEGATCATLNQGCIEDVSTNQAFLATEYWMEKGGMPETTIDSTYRTGYPPAAVWHSNHNYTHGIGNSLSEAIRDMHHMFKNAKTDGYSIVIGAGGSQLTHAAFYAYAQSMKRPTTVFSRTPYYYLTPHFANLNPGISSWNASYEQSKASNLVELVVSPNNPDGKFNTPYYSANQRRIWDLVFYWPLYVNVTSPHEEDVMIFSMSKVVGLSGSRIGWALVKDPVFADLMGDYIYNADHGVTLDAQYRSLVTLQYVLKTNGEIFNYVQTKLQARWQRVTALFAKNPNFAISSPSGFCLLWLECLTGKSQCFDLFLANGMLTIHGRDTGQDGFVRLNMMSHTSDFELMIQRIQALLSRMDALEREGIIPSDATATERANLHIPLDHAVFPKFTLPNRLKHAVATTGSAWRKHIRY